MNIGSASIVEARYTHDGRPEFEAGEFKELEARARGPDKLTPEENAMVAERKDEGNEHFRRGRVRDALLAYNKALEVFADRSGDQQQRREKSRLLANRAACLLKLEQWEVASKSAAMALRYDPANAKARFRRARALVELGGEQRFAEAIADLEQLRLEDGTHGKAERTLLNRLHAQQAELRQVRVRDAGGLRQAFQSGRAGLSSSVVDEEIVPVTAVQPAPTHPNAAWMLKLGGVSAASDSLLRHGWLVDCYRTRVDDDCAPGRTPHGIGAAACSSASLLLDFLIFCRLAVARGVVPRTTRIFTPHKPGEAQLWDWPAFLGDAAQKLGMAFNPEKCHAEYRYGEVMGSGKRMRELAMLLYDRVPPGEPSAEAVRRETMESCWRDGGRSEDGRTHKHMFTFDLNQAVFVEVGGHQPWRLLMAALCQNVR